MPVLVTGAAGFIGYHCCLRLLERGEEVVGVDNINDYYDPVLKQARLAILERYRGFTFHRSDIADREAMAEIARRHPAVDRIINLAAQAGVRYSLQNPFAYSHTNLDGFLVVLEMARHLGRLRHLVFASSSSVYGTNKKLPFSVEDRVDTPISLYAATKKANELMAHTYSHLYRLPTTGLRYFTVYGPWGRPDMAAFLFTKAIMAGEPIRVFNNGDMRRDFTYIDDIADGTIGVLDQPPQDDGAAPPYRLFNIGNHRSEPLMRFIGLIEKELGRKAAYQMEPMQPGDVAETYADIESIRHEIGFAPSTPIEIGIPRFIEWYKGHYGV